MEFLIYLVLGGFAGTLAGLFGVGGGMIIVPVLVYSFSLQGMNSDVLTHMAVGTSLATIVFTSINAIRAHHKKGAVRWHLFVWLTVGIVLGTVLGALTAAQISGAVLQKIIGVFAICVAIQMAFKLQPKASLGEPGKSVLGVAGGVIGWASAIFGIGGGSLTVPFLVWRSVPMQQAVATSSESECARQKIRADDATADLEAAREVLDEDREVRGRDRALVHELHDLLRGGKNTVRSTPYVDRRPS